MGGGLFLTSGQHSTCDLGASNALASAQYEIDSDNFLAISFSDLARKLSISMSSCKTAIREQMLVRRDLI